MSRPDRLISTGEAAKAVGLPRRTLSRWAAEGLITPTVARPGQRVSYWWDLDDLRRQLRELRERATGDR
jgi:DNA-binding transcriptional MerR regulator